jgi:hypothetical protein
MAPGTGHKEHGKSLTFLAMSLAQRAINHGMDLSSNPFKETIFKRKRIIYAY